LYVITYKITTPLQAVLPILLEVVAIHEHFSEWSKMQTFSSNHRAINNMSLKILDFPFLMIVSYFVYVCVCVCMCMCVCMQQEFLELMD